jgi:Polyketide cyclase / dehydrase and lipid transport
MPHVLDPATGSRRPRRRGARFALSLASALGGCASISQTAVSTPDGEQSRFEVAITREAVLPGDSAAVFAFITAEGVLPQILTGYGLLPAVVRTSDRSGPWDQPGSARIVHLADGSTVREQVTAFTAPHHFAYRVWDFGNPFIRRLADGARGDWTFETVGGSTRVGWTYTFAARNGWAALPLSGIARLQWAGYMDVCLANSRRLLGETARAP